jgi:hypothetical protein
VNWLSFTAVIVTPLLRCGSAPGHTTSLSSD